MSLSPEAIAAAEAIGKAAPPFTPAQLDVLRAHLGPAIEEVLTERVRAAKTTRKTGRKAGKPKTRTSKRKAA